MNFAELKVGDRVIFPKGYENYPFVMVDAGAVGTVVELHDVDNLTWVTMDEDFPTYDAKLWKTSEWPERGVELQEWDLEDIERVEQ